MLTKMRDLLLILQGLYFLKIVRYETMRTKMLEKFAIDPVGGGVLLWQTSRKKKVTETMAVIVMRYPACETFLQGS